MNTLTDAQWSTIKDLADLGLVKLQQVMMVPNVLRSNCLLIILEESK